MSQASRRALFLCSAFNGLTQQVWAYFADRFAESRLMIGVDIGEILTFGPDLVICPFLTERIPAEVHDAVPCFVVHPGPPGDGGPSSLNWAVLEGRKNWGVTVLQASGGWDAGPVWAHGSFPVPEKPVGYLYRHFVSQLAFDLLPLAWDRCLGGKAPEAAPPGTYRGRITDDDLRIDWDETTQQVLRKIHAGDPSPGALATFEGREFRLYGAGAGDGAGAPGTVVARDDDRIQVATGDGGVWVSRLADPDGVKIRAGELLRLHQVGPSAWAR